jgi:hypothetical protein
MKISHFLQVPFTGLGLYNGFRGDKWLIDRLNIFKSFVLPSIQNQTNQNFVLWICWRPEEKDNPIVQDFIASLSNVRDLNILHTFGGIMFWDDKFPDAEAEAKLRGNLEATLPELKPWVEGSDYVLVTLQPSDDMYLEDMVSRHQEFFEKDEYDHQALGYTLGYIENYATKEIAEYSCEPWKSDETSTYHTDTNPPFYTIKFPTDVFLDPAKHYDFIGPYHSHELVKNYLKMYMLNGTRGFVVGTHGANISTVWHHRYRSRVSLTQREQEGIMIRTGTLFADTYHVRKGWRLKLRDIFNRLPFQGAMRRAYHALPINLRKL